ncbi:MAG: energy-coupling factor ABC transporter ATP-binding protein, partial [Candidatus Ancillula sp.]|nr:energy-coupling factor ABC transporter ATP-binding protein [Candidatus Ancillula sp.]
LNKKNSQGEIKKGENIFGVVFQDPTMQILFDTVQEDIEFILSNYNVPKKEWEERIKLALDQVGMEGREKENPLTYSGGQKQRIAIAGMLALHPDYLIFDEASAHLDIEGKELFRKIVKKEASLGRGVIIVTNDPNEFDLADKNINLG